jgi:hypothetical protein
VVRALRVAGEIALPGTHILTDDNAEPLIEAGYLRRFTHEESVAILDEFYREAEEVFGRPSSQTNPKRETVGTQGGLGL